MFHLSISTRIAVEEPSPDGGFITWFDVQIHRDAPVVDEGGAGGDALEDGDEKVEQIGRAKLAIIHVGAIFDSEDTLYDVLDAESGDLEALYSLYFDDEEGSFKDEFASAAGVDLGYVHELSIDPAWRGRNIELAVVQRLNETVAAGCKVLVMPVSADEEISRWEQMGFELAVTARGEARHLHLNNEEEHPRVVPMADAAGIAAPDEEDRFRVQSSDDEDDEELEPVGVLSAFPPPTLPASSGRPHGAALPRPTAIRRPTRRRR